MNQNFIPIVAIADITSACENPAGKLPTLGELNRFKPGYQKAVLAVAESIKAAGERPEEFRVAINEEGNDLLVFELWHKSALTFKNRNVVGNPGGKCRTVIYRISSNQVTSTRFWQ